MRCLYFIVTPQQLWSSPGLARRVLAPYFPTKISHQNHQHVVFPEHMADLRFRGRESCLRHFRGAAKTANLLRGLSLMRKSCARSFATTKPPRKKAPEGAAARGEGEKQKETDERRGRQRLDKAAGSETQAESLRAEGARRPARAQGTLGSARNLVRG